MGEPAHELGESPECDAGTQRPVGDGRLLGMREHLDQDHAGEPTLGDCITQFLADLALRVALRQSAQSTRRNLAGKRLVESHARRQRRAA